VLHGLERALVEVRGFEVRPLRLGTASRRYGVMPRLRPTLTPVEVEGGAPADTSSNQAIYRTVSDSYLRTMRMSMAAGRWFTEADMRSPGGAFVINAAFAKRGGREGSK